MIAMLVDEKRGGNYLKAVHYRAYLKYRHWTLHIGLCDPCRKGNPCRQGEAARLAFSHAELSMRLKPSIMKELDEVLARTMLEVMVDEVPEKIGDASEVGEDEERANAA